MTVLSACQSAAIRLIGKKPATIFSSNGTFELEMKDLVQDVAVDIAKLDWQALTKLATISGDGEAVAFDLPDDYQRMPKKADVHSKTWNTWIYTPARDLDQWLDFQTYLSVGTPGVWIILDGKMQIFPAISTTEEAKFYYISKNIFTSDSGSDKAAATKDDDTFKLDERVLTLGLIWRWRAQKRLEYSEDLVTYEKALAEAYGTDKGSRLLRPARNGEWGDLRVSYPGRLGQ